MREQIKRYPLSSRASKKGISTFIFTPLPIPPAPVNSSLPVSQKSKAATFSSRPENRVAVRMLQAIDVCYARIYHQVIVRSPCKLPDSGPAMLVSNHISSLDPLLIQSVCPRLITWMMAKEYFGNPILDWVFKTVGIIPVERSGRDLASTRAAMRALHDGRVLGVFPEGRIAASDDMLSFHTGAAMMAIKTGVDIYPVYIDGTQRRQDMLEAMLRRNRCTISFGAAIKMTTDDTSRQSLERVTAEIRIAIEGLRTQQQLKNSSNNSHFSSSRRTNSKAT
jgi:1-acyl-sn-glycerol-3-phosphate acyltransferase